MKTAAWGIPLRRAWRQVLRLRRVPVTPVALAVVWLASGATVWRDYRVAEEDTLRLAALHARVLADHATRTLAAVDLMLDASASRLDAMLLEDKGQARPGADLVQRTLADVAAGQPMVRSLSLVRQSGYVESSSQSVNVGQTRAPVLFMPMQGQGRLALRLASGRDLADASLELDPASMHHVLLVSRPLMQAQGHEPLWLVATLNPEYFSTQHELMLTGPAWRSALLAPEGTVLAATSNLPLGPGTGTRWVSAMEGTESGLATEAGLAADDALGAWRVARRYPVRAQAELPRELALAEWRSDSRQLAALAALLSALVAGLGVAARRHRSARETADRERRRAQQQLREQYEMTEQLVDAMAVPVFLTDLAGNLLLANRAWVQIMALDSEAASAGAQEERHARVQRLLERGIGEVCATGSTHWSQELPLPDGTLRDTEVTRVALRGDQGQVRGVIGTLVDVTEYKQAARATETARRAAEAASQARAEFVANVTHELRTPLQSILGFAELGEDRAAGQDKLQLMFRRVHGAGTRMLRLVDDLLDISRIGSTVGSIKLQVAPVCEPLREVVDELRTLAQQRGLRLELRVDDALQGALARIDAMRLQQVARNVIANALRFAPAGTAVEIQLLSQDGMAVMQVRDHGPGIPKAETESIFEPFVQSSRTKDGSGGTGLGLTICRQIMQAHGGFIVAGNHLGGGALFRFGLPLAAAAQAQEA